MYRPRRTPGHSSASSMRPTPNSPRDGSLRDLQGSGRFRHRSRPAGQVWHHQGWPEEEAQGPGRRVGPGHAIFEQAARGNPWAWSRGVGPSPSRRPRSRSLSAGPAPVEPALSRGRTRARGIGCCRGSGRYSGRISATDTLGSRSLACGTGGPFKAGASDVVPRDLRGARSPAGAPPPGAGRQRLHAPQDRAAGLGPEVQLHPGPGD